MKYVIILAVLFAVCYECNGQLLSTLLGAGAAVHNRVHTNIHNAANAVLGGIHHGGGLDFNFHIGGHHGQQQQPNQQKPPKETVIVIVEKENPDNHQGNGNKDPNSNGNYQGNGNNYPNPNENYQGNGNKYPNSNSNYQGNGNNYNRPNGNHGNNYPNPNGNHQGNGNNLPNKNEYGSTNMENKEDNLMTVDEPTRIDFNPNQYDFGKDKTSTSSPKRDTDKKPAEDEFDLDERFGDIIKQ